MTLSPVVTSTSLSENEVVGSEELTKRTSSNRVHGTRLKIHKNGSWDVSATSSFIVVNVDSLQLQIGVSVVGTSGIDSVLIRNDFPELGTDLVTALTTLNVNDFSHLLLFLTLKKNLFINYLFWFQVSNGFSLEWRKLDFFFQNLKEGGKSSEIKFILSFKNKILSTIFINLIEPLFYLF
jgi:hypothetical protein